MAAPKKKKVVYPTVEVEVIREVVQRYSLDVELLVADFVEAISDDTYPDGELPGTVYLDPESLLKLEEEDCQEITVDHRVSEG